MHNFWLVLLGVLPGLHPHGWMLAYIAQGQNAPRFFPEMRGAACLLWYAGMPVVSVHCRTVAPAFCQQQVKCLHHSNCTVQLDATSSYVVVTCRGVRAMVPALG